MATPFTRGALDVLTTGGVSTVLTLDSRPEIPRDGRSYQSFGWSVAASSDGSVLVFGDWNEGPSVYTYDWSGTAWVERSTSPLEDGSGFNRFGQSVALSADGSVLAVSEPLYDTGAANRGRVRIYDYNSGTGAWDFRNEILGASANDQFGWGIDLSDDGTVLAVGQIGGTASFVLYDWSDPNWVLRTGSTLTVPSTIAYTVAGGWGRHCALSGDGTRLVAAYQVSSPNNSFLAGVWDWGGASWSRVGVDIVTPDGPTQDTMVGFDINYDGSRIYVLTGQWFTSTWESKIVPFDDVASTWTADTLRAGEYGEPLFVDVDFADGAGIWVSEDETLTFAAQNTGFLGDIGIHTYGYPVTVGSTCIQKVYDQSEKVVVGSYCTDVIVPPTYYEPDPVNVPQPPFGGYLGGTPTPNQEVPNCGSNFYNVLEYTASLVNDNDEYEAWLVENRDQYVPTSGICL